VPADPRLVRADRLIDVGRWQDAERLVREVLASAPDDALAYRLLARALLTGHRDEEAATAVARAIELAPDDAVGHRLRSALLMRAEHNEEAMAAAREAVRLDPFSWVNHMQIAAVGIRQGRLAASWSFSGRRAWRRAAVEARDAAREAARLAPDQSPPYGSIGQSELQLGHLRAAMTAQRRALQINPGDPVALANVAVLHILRGSIVRAATTTRQSLAALPMLDTMAWNVGTLVVRALWMGWLAVTAVVLVAYLVADDGTPLAPRVMVTVALLGIVAWVGARVWHELGPGLRRHVWRRLYRHPRAWVLVPLLVVVTAGAVAASVLPRGDARRVAIACLGGGWPGFVVWAALACYLGTRQHRPRGRWRMRVEALRARTLGR
jgi:Flp pilus assembly protein TadD